MASGDLWGIANPFNTTWGSSAATTTSGTYWYQNLTAWPGTQLMGAGGAGGAVELAYPEHDSAEPLADNRSWLDGEIAAVRELAFV